MNLRIPSLIALALISAPTSAFVVDTSPVDSAAALNIPTLSTLEVGQKAWADQSKVTFCLNAENELQIENALPIELSDKLKQANYEITRVDAGVDIKLSSTQLDSQRDKYHRMAYQISNAKVCHERIDHYLPVNKVLGATSQSELLTLSDDVKIAKPEKVSPKRLDSKAKSISNWFVDLERDENESPVSVTYSQPDQTQHTLFEVKCEALDVKLTAAVNDFLSDGSQNVLIRFNQDKFKPIRLTLTDNSRGFTFPDVEEVWLALRQSEQMSLRYTNYNGETHTLNYPLEGLSEKLKTYPELCGSE